MHKPVILFDLDGTLIDSTEAILESFASAFKKLGGSVPDAERIKALVGHPLPEMFRRMGVAEDRIDAYVQAYKEYYAQVHTRKTVLLPHAKEAVQCASGFARLGVVTTKTGRYSRQLLEYFGIMDAFEVLIGSEDVTRHKPHPEPILEALRRMEAYSEDAWMIGDTCMDIEAARAAGIRPLGVGCGYGDPEVLRACGAELSQNAWDAVAKIRTQTEIL